MTEENKIVSFVNNQFGTIRTLTIDNQPWFVGKDVAKILGYTNPSKAIADHIDDDDKLNNDSLSSLGQRGGWIINESGLYSLILSSKLPTAKDFKRWVTSVVLPQIRQTGGYIPISSDQTEEEQKQTAYDILMKTVKLQDELLQSTKPKVEAFDDFMQSQGYLQFIDVAGMLHIGRTKLLKFLRDSHILTKQSNFNIPYGKYLHSPYFKVVAGVKQGKPVTVTIVSPDGVEFIRKMLVKNNMIANEQEVA
jgi:anti-repressor protein